jgi:phage repressor protein C with HTH and peptisase S24 domain
MYLREVRKSRKMTLEQLAEIVGTTKSNLSLIENGKINMSVDKAEKIAKTLNCLPTDLTGSTKFNPNEKSKMIQIKYYDISASAGLGCFVNNNNFEYINIDEIQLKKMGIRGNYDGISIINANGNSMSPTIKDGDLLFVNTEQKEIFNNKIYIISENNYLKVKRIIRNSPFDTKIAIKSDNEIDGEYPPYEVDIDGADNIICGQVIFFCRNIK